VKEQILERGVKMQIRTIVILLCEKPLLLAKRLLIVKWDAVMKVKKELAWKIPLKEFAKKQMVSGQKVLIVMFPSVA
jgi:hypothetical protein